MAVIGDDINIHHAAGEIKVIFTFPLVTFVREFILVESAGFNVKKASSLRINVIVRCVRVTTVAMGQQ
jgi:hypothetical protein